MALFQGQVGLPSTRQTSGNPTALMGTFGELYESRLLPDYYSLLKAGRVFTSTVAAANPTAFTGGAAGTPLIGIYNPAGSGVDLVLLEAVIGVRTTGTAAAATDFSHFGANQGATAITGALTAPRQLYSMTTTGSVAQALANVANTGALASALLRPSVSLGNVPATTAVLNYGLFRDEIKGEIVIAPGIYYAFGASATLTAASIDVAVMWAEVPA